MTDGLGEAYDGRKWDAFSEANELRLEVDQLKAENARLRELVRDMHRCYVRGHDWGPWGAPEKESIEDRMRALGIEVDR